MKRNDRNIVLLVAVAHSFVHIYELSIPIFLTIWLDIFEVSRTELGIIVALGYALFGLGSLPGGILVDRYGSQRFIGGSLLGMGLAFLVLSVANSVAVIGLALVTWGIAASVYHPSGLSLISKGVQARGDAFAYHGIAGNLGIACGPLLTALLVMLIDWRLVSLLLAVPAILAAGGTVYLQINEEAASDTPDESASSSEHLSLRQVFMDSRTLFGGGFVIIFLIVMCSGLYYRGILTFLPELLSAFEMFQTIELSEQSFEPSRYFYVGLLMVGTIGQYAGGKLSDRIPTERGLAVVFTSLAVIAVVFLPASTAGLGPLVAIGILLGICLFAAQPLYQATVAEYTPPGTRGLSYGYTYLAVFGVGALGAAIAGTLLDLFAPQVLFLVLAGFATSAALLGMYLDIR